MTRTERISAPRKILIAAVGNSPSILTETVWALANQEQPWIPEQVVMVTTRTGKEISERILLRQGGWDLLCKALSSRTDQLAFGSQDSIRVIGDGRKDFDDIRTPEESAVTADFLLGVLRQYTEQPETEIVASIAGGRKTMSALMLACMSLLGRTQDRVCHVLVHDRFIAGHPDFLFPRNVKELKASGLQLCDIPFVRVRGWYEKEYSGIPPSYMTLVNRFARIAPERSTICRQLKLISSDGKPYGVW
jgi:CRISPR-associated protein (TIGR02584 family)